MAALPEQDLTVAAIFASYERDRATLPPRGYLGGSELGEDCKRMLWYRFRQARQPSFPGRILRLFDTGSREEDRIVADLRSVGCEVLDKNPDTDEQWGFVECKGHLKGHADGVVLGLLESPKTWHLLEAKSSNKKYFEAMLKHGCEKSKPVHWAQCQLYMGGLGLTRAVYIVWCKDDDRLYFERIKFDPKAYKALLAKATSIIFTNEPPTRIGKDRTFYKCKFCDMADLCWCEAGEAWPAVNCRTCTHSTPVDDGEWSCAIWPQRVGTCDQHVYLPPLIHWAKPIDGGDDWVRYRMGDYEFINCAAGAFPAAGCDHFSSLDLSK